MPRVLVKIEAKVRWHYQKEAGGSWVAICDPLGLTLEADSKAELPPLIEDAIETLFIDLHETGELDEFLASRGWRSSTPIPIASDEPVHFHVPWELIHRANSGNLGGTAQ